MITDEKLTRINELARKAKAEGLTMPRQKNAMHCEENILKQSGQTFADS